MASALTYRAAAATAFTGFGMIRRRPFTVLGWGLFSFVAFSGLFSLVAVLAGSAFLQFARFSQLGPGQTPSPQEASALLGLLGGVMAGYGVMILGTLVLSSVLGCAVFRFVLEPQKQGFAYLRFGRQELLLILVAVAAYVLLLIASLPISMVLGVVMSIYLMVSHATPSPERIQVASIAMDAVIYPFMIFLMARFCLAFPMSFAERRFRLLESWGMTRGHSLKLMLMVVIQFVSQWLTMAPIVVIAVAALAYYRIPLSLDGMVSLSHLTLHEAFSRFWPAGLAIVVLGGPVWGILAGCYYGPFAEIYRRLRPEAADAFS